MATKATNKTSKKKVAPKAKAPAKKAAAPKAEKKPSAPPKARHPRARVIENHTSKEALAKSLAPLLGRGDEDAETVETRLKTASNAQLLRLSQVTATVKQKYGNRDKLIEAIGNAGNKSKDKDYLTKLATYSLPQLLDIANSTDRRVKAASAAK